MDTKNVVAAISLSAAVIIFYSLFFSPQPVQNPKKISENNKIENDSDAPSLEQKQTLVKISREEALTQNERVIFENENIRGSISLRGAIIDDLTFIKYNTELESTENVTLLNPKNIEEGYFIESGFVTTDKNINVPNSETLWSIEGNKILNKTYRFFQYYNNNYRPIYHLESYLLYLILATNEY